MKVLQISPVAPPQRSGMANAAGEIYKATKEAVELSSTDGAEVELVAPFGGSTILGLKHKYVPGAGFLAFTPALVALCKKYDLIHLHYPCYGNAMMVSLARMFGNKKPLIVSYHMDTVGRGLRRPVFWLHAKFLAPPFLRQADVIAVASRDYAEHSLLAKYPELMAKVVEIPFGVDTDRFSPSSLSPRAAEAKRGEGRVRGSVLFVAALDEQHYFKGLHVLLEAMAKVPDAKLTVVGDGNLKNKYLKKAKELAISDRVVFAGRVSDEELPKYYQDADLFCSASLDRSEAYGIVLMEAAASGLPAVATNIPGVRTVVEDGETGFLVPPDDAGALAEALRDLLNDPELLAKMGAAARAFALTRTWPAVGKKYLEIYKSLR
jgi:glycosyltransferase involved in cell wall biosynthesis